MVANPVSGALTHARGWVGRAARASSYCAITALLIYSPYPESPDWGAVVMAVQVGMEMRFQAKRNLRRTRDLPRALEPRKPGDLR
jgi:hypothetical protein